MDKNSKKKRLEQLLSHRKIEEELKRQKLSIEELFNCFPDTNEIDVLNNEESKKVVNRLESHFPIASWGRIDWNQVKKKEYYPTKKTPSLNELLEFLSISPNSTFYLILNNSVYPVIKASIKNIFEGLEDAILLGSNLWMYSVNEEFVIEVCHDDTVAIGWL